MFIINRSPVINSGDFVLKGLSYKIDEKTHCSYSCVKIYNCIQGKPSWVYLSYICNELILGGLVLTSNKFF